MRIRIGLGLANLPFGEPSAFWRFVERCEAGGVDSLWQTDRLVSDHPQLEPMSLMASLAGATQRLKFGMNVVVVTFRDPLVLAKECATIDWLSGGRLLPAFGVGPAIAPEWAATGRDPKGSGALVDEALDIMVRLWAGDRVTTAGRYFHYTDARIAPLPLQRPLPLWIGGRSAAAIRRTAGVGTGWLGGVESPEQAGAVVTAIKTASEAAGRPLDPDHYGAAFGFRFGSADDPLVQRTGAVLAALAGTGDPARHVVAGGAQDILARIDEYVAVGVSKFVLRPIALREADVMDQTARLIAEVIPAVHVRTNAA
jgi:probable F420-dependent oxidoreductase